MSGHVANANHASLALLRANPDSAMSKFGFIVDASVYQSGTIGGACALSCAPAGGNLFRLTAGPGSGDFYYPYCNMSDGGVGLVTVPKGQPDGTIVVTGGMNGCSLQVNKSGNDFIFYHELNGSALTGKLTPGTVVCRVDWKDYAGPLNLGKNLADSKSKSTKTLQVSAWDVNYCIVVRKGGRWNVYYSAILVTGTTKFSTSFLGKTKTKKSEEYAAFKPTLTPLITSFADA